MNDEISYRAYNPRQKRMIFGPHEETENAGWVLTMCQANKTEAMEFTGRKDISGTRIFTKDILGDTEGHVIGVVVWDDDELTYAVMNHTPPGEPWCVGWLSDYESCSIEVLGSTYENPELLEAGHE